MKVCLVMRIIVCGSVFGDVENHCFWEVCLVMLRIIVCGSVFGDVKNHCL